MNEIRFDLEDILEANLVEDVLHSINMMVDKVMFKEIKFWHNGGITDKQINVFVDRYNKIVKAECPLKISKRSPQIEYAWFDVISDAKSNGSKSRFSYVYPKANKSEIIRGLHNYSNIVSFLETAGQGKRVYYKPKENGK
jgi:hypothetical protein